MQRAPRELAVTDLAASRRTEAADFADRIGREVIMEHEILIRQAIEPVDHLLGFLGAQRAGRDGLRLAAGEQRRAMRARQEVGFGLDRTNLRRRAAVDALAVLRSEEHTSELQSLMRISYAVFCLKKKKQKNT